MFTSSLQILLTFLNDMLLHSEIYFYMNEVIAKQVDLDLNFKVATNLHLTSPNNEKMAQNPPISLQCKLGGWGLRAERTRMGVSASYL